MGSGHCGLRPGARARRQPQAANERDGLAQLCPQLEHRPGFGARRTRELGVLGVLGALFRLRQCPTYARSGPQDRHALEAVVA